MEVNNNDIIIGTIWAVTKEKIIYKLSTLVTVHLFNKYILNVYSLGTGLGTGHEKIFSCYPWKQHFRVVSF